MCEQLAKAVQPLVKLPAVCLNPAEFVLETPGAKPAAAGAPDLFGGDQSGRFQDLHVLFGPGKRDAQELGQLADRGSPHSQPFQDGTTAGIG